MTTNPAPPKKTRSPAIRAAAAFNKIRQLEAERDEEIANAPTSITVRYASRIESVACALDDEAHALLAKMLGE